MQNRFYQLSDFLHTQTRDGEVWLANFHGEESDFIRFNQAKVRQAGSVAQRHFNLHLIHGLRHANYSMTLSGEFDGDQTLLRRALDALREQLPYLPEDPHLLYATEPASSESIGADCVPPAGEVLGQVLELAQGTDFVGIYAGGGMYIGFANSFGQRNWHARHSFNLDWSLYHSGDKAVKSAYAGFEWEPAALRDKFAHARAQLSVLARPPRTIEPGEYRAYLAPAALQEVLGMLAGGFGLKAQRTKQSPLLRMLDNGQTLHDSIDLVENTAAGVGPDFQSAGFRKPAQIPLIRAGRYAESLVSPRSAKEYGVPGNGANGGEYAESLDLAAGDVLQAEVLARLDTGLYIDNLWYLNYSDLAACRLTGMTRFATFWVENGEITAPLNVMRFDDTAYALLGDKLRGLTREREFLLDPSTYGARSTMSNRLPGALIEGMRFTL